MSSRRLRASMRIAPAFRSVSYSAVFLFKPHLKSLVGERRIATAACGETRALSQNGALHRVYGRRLLLTPRSYSEVRAPGRTYTGNPSRRRLAAAL